MMVWVLFFITSTFMHTQEFSNQENCMAAKTKMEEIYKNQTSKSIGNGVFECVKR